MTISTESEFIDLAHKERVTTKLYWQGEELTEQEVADLLVKQAITYLDAEDSNEVRTVVQPLAARLMLPFMKALVEHGDLPLEEFQEVVSSVSVRYVMVWMALLGYMTKGLTEAGLSVVTEATKISDEEIDGLLQLEELSQLVLKAQAAGVSMEKVVEAVTEELGAEDLERLQRLADKFRKK